jgi:hypothetical protein
MSDVRNGFLGSISGDGSSDSSASTLGVYDSNKSHFISITFSIAKSLSSEELTSS